MISKICICFIIFGTKINLYNTRKNSISCYTCTSPPYPGGGVDFDKDMCKSQICNGLIDKQKCVKIIEKIEGQTRYTRACLDVIYSSSHREEIPADTYRGCRKASDKISRPGDPYVRQKPKFYEKSFCFCDEWDNCNSGNFVYINIFILYIIIFINIIYYII